MSRFRTYDNFSNRNNTRIDARPKNDEATQAGMRGVHRDTKGNVIGGYTAEGQAIGSKSRFRQMGSGRSLLADGPQTPGLDRRASMQRPTPAPSFAAQDRAAKDQSAASGAFGAAAQNRSKRRDLFRDMQVAGKGGVTDGFRSRASELGVTLGGWDRATNKLTDAPAMIARTDQPTPKASAPPTIAAINSLRPIGVPAPKPVTPAPRSVAPNPGPPAAPSPLAGAVGQIGGTRQIGSSMQKLSGAPSRRTWAQAAGLPARALRRNPRRQP